MSKKNLKNLFPDIRTREEIHQEILSSPKLSEKFNQWSFYHQGLFLDFCSGVNGSKVLYDVFFKEIFDPIKYPERLEEMLSLILKDNIKIVEIIPNDGNTFTKDGPIVIMDIVIRTSNGSLANVECQRNGIYFPGQRAACYSSDLVMREYSRLKQDCGKKFAYSDMKKVYTIVIYEHSTREFKSVADKYIHHSKQQFDTPLELDLLQEYYFIALDIYMKYHHNKGINNQLEAWLTFLGSDDPADILELITKYPKFREYYDNICKLLLNIEDVMNMWSEALYILDENTKEYMIEEQRVELDKTKAERDIAFSERDIAVAESLKKDEEIAELKRTIELLSKN